MTMDHASLVRRGWLNDNSTLDMTRAVTISSLAPRTWLEIASLCYQCLIPGGAVLIFHPHRVRKIEPQLFESGDGMSL